MGNIIDNPGKERPEAENTHNAQGQGGTPGTSGKPGTPGASEASGTPSGPLPFKEDFVRRCRDNKATRWVRFGIVTLIYILWTIWMSNAWLLLALPLLFDIYITGYIPFTWWKHSKNKAVRTIMSWVDAIVYALILVYFIFNFIGQNYQIPSSSLERTLLTGDYLWVNKVVYGPRVPMTPVHFPLVHSSFPAFIGGGKSYMDSPSLSYHRLPGLRDVEQGDIVVFNYPAGDTVTTFTEESGESYYALVERFGRDEVYGHPEKYGKVVYRPVDRRTNYVKRCVGLPGQRLRIVDDVVYTDGKAMATPENAQFRYLVAAATAITPEQADELDISYADIQYVTPGADMYLPLLSMVPGATDTDVLQIVPLTKAARGALAATAGVHGMAKFNDLHLDMDMELFPAGVSRGWTLSNYGGSRGLLIPKKGMTIKLNPEVWPIYERVIRNYEGHLDSYVRNGRVYVDGRPATTYTFAMDYYFMMGDNRDLSLDSRFWGFVPEDHVVGTPMFVIVSIDPERSIFRGGFRWNRLFKDANPDK